MCCYRSVNTTGDTRLVCDGMGSHSVLLLICKHHWCVTGWGHPRGIFTPTSTTDLASRSQPTTKLHVGATFDRGGGD